MQLIPFEIFIAHVTYKLTKEPLTIFGHVCFGLSYKFLFIFTSFFFPITIITTTKTTITTAQFNIIIYGRSHLYNVAVFAAGRSKVQIAQERQSVFARPPDLQLVRSTDFAVVRSVASCKNNIRALISPAEISQRNVELI